MAASSERLHTLYVSDLDGTLLDASGRVSEETAALLNPLLDRGLPFTIATARTAATALEILSPLHLRLPVVLLNGVLLYDLQHERYLLVREIEKQAARRVAALFEAHGRDNFLFTFTGTGLGVYYKPEQGNGARQYREARTGMPHKVFLPTDDYLAAVEEAPIVFFNAIGRQEELLPLYETVQQVSGVRAVFYQDTYGERLYYLEVFAETASKSNTVQALREMLGAETLCCFGDNRNDLDMLQAADLACAVANAVPEVREAADLVLGSNEASGVARFLQQRWQQDTGSDR